MRKWIAGILAAVIGGLILWAFTHPGGIINPTPPPPPPPTRELSFLEKLAGSYTLGSWVKANLPIELGAKITSGTLQIDPTGLANWTVNVEQTNVVDPGKVKMTARGQVQLGSQPPIMTGVQGGEFNNTQYLDAKWGQVSDDVDLAVRGWTVADEDQFTLALDQQGGKTILQMKNSRGTYTWIQTR